jgi:hypothetical protein
MTEKFKTYDTSLIDEYDFNNSKIIFKKIINPDKNYLYDTYKIMLYFLENNIPFGKKLAKDSIFNYIELYISNDNYFSIKENLLNVGLKLT